MNQNLKTSCFRLISIFRSISRGSALALLLGLSLGASLILPTALAETVGGVGSEGQGSLPFQDVGSGLALVGEMDAVLAVLGETSGEGELVFLDLGTTGASGASTNDSTIAALISGDLQIALDPELLASSEVSVHLVLGNELGGGLAMAEFGAWSSDLFFLPEFSVEVPIAAIYGSETSRSLADLRLRVRGRDGTLLDLRIGMREGALSVNQAWDNWSYRQATRGTLSPR